MERKNFFRRLWKELENKCYYDCICTLWENSRILVGIQKIFLKEQERREKGEFVKWKDYQVLSN
jgi:hypothetical protein